MSRVRADRYTNREGTGAPTFSQGVNIVGMTSITGVGSTALLVNGDAQVSSGSSLYIANGNVVFSTSGTGIDFSATSDGSGTTTSELLDDYEEGTWTPTIGGNTGSSGNVYNYQQGQYTKIGNVVIAHFKLQISSWGTNTGFTTVIGGFPFASLARSQETGHFNVVWANTNTNFVNMYMYIGATSSTGGAFRGYAAATAADGWVAPTSIKADTVLSCSFAYYAT